QRPDATFWIANGLAETFGWSRQRLAAARESIIQRGYIRRLRAASNNQPALYRWSSLARGRRVYVEYRCKKSDTPTRPPHESHASRPPRMTAQGSGTCVKKCGSVLTRP